MKREEFQKLIREKGRELYRDMPWRRDTRFYYVLVSELMLQQTQVSRVVPKFETFIARFPDIESLAAASLDDVLRLWSGLGYNRRAKYLHEAARRIRDVYYGGFPQSLRELQTLPGVGSGTAGALMVYALNQPAVFIETNVRTVYFQHFFPDDAAVSDADLRLLVEDTLDRECPREFYWALMDYGTWLKSQGAGRLQQSRHYKKQAPLKGSVREVRGRILRALTTGELRPGDLRDRVVYDQRFDTALASLIADGLIAQTSGMFHLTK
jgi:A/G-specific adenine glycosylase